MDSGQMVRPYDEMDKNSVLITLLGLFPALAADIAGKWATGESRSAHPTPVADLTIWRGSNGKDNRAILRKKKWKLRGVFEDSVDGC